MARGDKKRLLVLGASRYYKSSIEAIRRCGFEVYAIDRNPDAPGFALADGFGVVDITDASGATEYARKIRADGVMAINDFGIMTAACVAKELGLAGISPEVAGRVTDKALMRKAWQEAGVLNPAYFVAETIEEVSSRAADLKYPLIVKPADSRGGGSRGVKVVSDQAELKEAFEFSQSFYDDKRVLVEECVKGTEHSVEVVVIDRRVHVIAVSEKEKTPYPYRVDKRVIYPALLDERDGKVLEDAVTTAVEAIGIESGVAHVELALTPEGPILFEIGARFGGGATPEIVKECTGVGYLEAGARLALGEPIYEEQLKTQALKGAVYHFFIFDEGTVVRRADIEKIREVETVMDFELFCDTERPVSAVTIGPERHGFAVIVAADRVSALRDSRHLDEIFEGTRHAG